MTPKTHVTVPNETTGVFNDEAIPVSNEVDAPNNGEDEEGGNYDGDKFDEASPSKEDADE